MMMPVNIKLTDNFRLKEFFVSRDHPEIAEKLFKECTNFQIHLAYALAKDAQRIRDYIDAPLIITRGYASDELNQLTAGSAERSLHMQMLAFDVVAKDPHDLYRVYKFFLEGSDRFDYSECYLYRTESGVYTNIHYARQTAGYDEKKHGILVRVPNGKPIPLEEYENGTHSKR